MDQEATIADVELETGENELQSKNILMGDGQSWSTPREN